MLSDFCFSTKLRNIIIKSKNECYGIFTTKKKGFMIKNIRMKTKQNKQNPYIGSKITTRYLVSAVK